MSVSLGANACQVERLQTGDLFFCIFSGFLYLKAVIFQKHFYVDDGRKSNDLSANKLWGDLHILPHDQVFHCSDVVCTYLEEAIEASLEIR